MRGGSVGVRETKGAGEWGKERKMKREQSFKSGEEALLSPVLLLCVSSQPDTL